MVAHDPAGAVCNLGALLVGLIWLLSENRSAVSWKTIGVGIVIQAVLALMLCSGLERHPFWISLHLATFIS